MPKRNRGIRSALKLVGIILAFLLAAAVCAAVISYGRWKQVEYNREAYQRHREYSRNSYYPARDACLLLPSQNQMHCIAEATNRARENEREEQDLVAQRVTAVWTFLMGCAAIIGMGLSAVGVFLVFTTFNATREANRIAIAANRMLADERRPLLKFTATPSAPFGEGSIPLTILAENVGDRPAIAVSFHCEVYRQYGVIYLPHIMDEFVGYICGFEAGEMGLVIMPTHSHEFTTNFSDNDALDGVVTNPWPHTMLVGITYRSPGRPEVFYTVKLYSLTHGVEGGHGWSAREDKEAQRIA